MSETKLTPIEIVEQFDGLSQHGVSSMVDIICDKLADEDTLPWLAKLKAMEDVIKGVKSRLKQDIIDDASKHPEKSFTVGGVKFEKRTRKSYSFDHFEGWQRLKQKLAELEQTMKITDGNTQVEADTGEFIPPAQFTETEYIAITLPKHKF